VATQTNRGITRKKKEGGRREIKRG